MTHNIKNNNDDEFKPLSKEKLKDIDLCNLSNDNSENRTRYNNEPMLDLMYNK